MTIGNRMGLLCVLVIKTHRLEGGKKRGIAILRFLALFNEMKGADYNRRDPKSIRGIGNERKNFGDFDNRPADMLSSSAG
jgi:hypothetical protein